MINMKPAAKILRGATTVSFYNRNTRAFPFAFAHMGLHFALEEHLWHLGLIFNDHAYRLLFPASKSNKDEV